MSSRDVRGEAEGGREADTLCNGESWGVDVKLLAVSHHSCKGCRVLVISIHSDSALGAPCCLSVCTHSKNCHSQCYIPWLYQPGTSNEHSSAYPQLFDDSGRRVSRRAHGGLGDGKVHTVFGLTQEISLLALQRDGVSDFLNQSESSYEISHISSAHS
jgi:hypothetical protein